MAVVSLTVLEQQYGGRYFKGKLSLPKPTSFLVFSPTRPFSRSGGRVKENPRNGLCSDLAFYFLPYSITSDIGASEVQTL